MGGVPTKVTIDLEPFPYVNDLRLDYCSGTYVEAGQDFLNPTTISNGQDRAKMREVKRVLERIGQHPRYSFEHDSDGGGTIAHLRFTDDKGGWCGIGWDRPKGPGSTTFHPVETSRYSVTYHNNQAREEVTFFIKPTAELRRLVEKERAAEERAERAAREERARREATSKSTEPLSVTASTSTSTVRNVAVHRMLTHTHAPLTCVGPLNPKKGRSAAAFTIPARERLPDQWRIEAERKVGKFIASAWVNITTGASSFKASGAASATAVATGGATVSLAGGGFLRPPSGITAELSGEAHGEAAGAGTLMEHRRPWFNLHIPATATRLNFNVSSDVVVVEVDGAALAEVPFTRML